MGILPTANAQTTLGLATTYHFFDYTEFDTFGNKYNKERGGIPGLELALKIKYFNQRLKSSLSATLLESDVKYTGRTNRGALHTTRTDERIAILSMRTQLLFSHRSNRRFWTFLSLRNYEWQRDIRPKNNIAGLFEVYEWLETSAGIRLNIENKNVPSWAVEVSLLHTGLFNYFSPTIYVDLAQVEGGTTTLDLGSDTGYRLLFEISQNIQHNMKVSVLTYHESWDFGRSNTQFSTGGARQLLVTEPRSETRNSGLQFRLEISLD